MLFQQGNAGFRASLTSLSVHLCTLTRPYSISSEGNGLASISLKPIKKTAHKRNEGFAVMQAIVFQCPVTGLDVQLLVDDGEANPGRTARDTTKG